jgi:hypothetical protein
LARYFFDKFLESLEIVLILLVELLEIGADGMTTTIGCGAASLGRKSGLGPSAMCSEPSYVVDNLE